MRTGYEAATFWDERFRQFGHTGWADNWLYRYDQPLRLKAVARILSRNGVQVNQETQALDIGCGTGDFIQVLTTRGAKVSGIDISQETVERAKGRFAGNSQVRLFVNRVEALDFPAGSFNLVLSVTVLQHVIEEKLFLTAVQNIVNMVKKGGHILLLESSPCRKAQGSVSHYISIRTRQEWADVFQQAGCSLVDESSYPHWGIVFLDRINRLSKVIFAGRGGDSSSRRDTAPKKRRHRLSNLLSRLVLGISYPLDRWLSMSPPLRIAQYRIFLFRKQ